MALKIFLTGVTGYVGGDAFYALYEKHPEYEYALLVRSEERAAPVKKAYPNVRLVIGTLSDVAIIEKEAAAADVVIHTAESADDAPSARAIAKGLAEGHSPEKPGFWIHVSGAAILFWYDQKHERYGEAPFPDQEYNDVRDIDRILAFPDDAPHRDVDKLVLGANSAAVRAAVLCPPTIYGPGRGPVNRRSMQVPLLATATLEKGFAPIVAPGKTEWNHVHVRDLSGVFLALVEAARDPARNADPDVFGPRAYYFVEAGEHAWADVAAWVAEEARGLGFLPAPLTKEVSLKEALQSGAVAVSLALNSKGKAERARKYLGWEPRAESLRETIAGAIETEAARLKMEPHEKKEA